MREGTKSFEVHELGGDSARLMLTDDVLPYPGGGFGLIIQWKLATESGIMEYDRVAELHQFLGKWLREFETEGGHKHFSKLYGKDNA